MIRILASLVVTIGPFLDAEEISLIAPRRLQSSSPPVIATPAITLEAGDLATARYLSPSVYLDVTINDLTIRLDANDAGQVNLPVIAGPAVIKLVSISTSNHSLATFSIKRAAEAAPAVSPQAVVIPDDGSGDRQVSLESSTDLVNWTTTQPGIFGAANASRFFRVRVIRAPDK